MRIFLLVAMIARLALFPAIAEEGDTNSANAVLPMCLAAIRFLDREPGLNAADSFKAGYCLGIIRTAQNLSPLFKVCSPTGVDNGQSVRVAVAFIRKNPARMHEPFELLALDAFREAWPCSSGR